MQRISFFGASITALVKKRLMASSLKKCKEFFLCKGVDTMMLCAE